MSSEPRGSPTSDVFMTLGKFFVCSLIVLTIFGDVLVYTAFYLNNNLRSRSNAFFLSLVTSDILSALFVMPIEVFVLSNYPFWPLGEIPCKIWSSMFVALCGASVLNLCAVGIDRFLAISRPLRYNPDMSSSLAVCLIFLWSFAFISGVASYFIWITPNPLVCSMLSTPLESAVWFLLFDLLIPFCICLLMYAKIFQISLQQARRETTARRWVCGEHKSSSLPRKSVKTLSLLVGSFVVCFLPFLVYHCVDGALEGRLPNRLYIGSVVKWLTFSNSAMNWALYGILNLEYRKALIRIFRVLGCKFWGQRTRVSAGANCMEVQTIS